MRRTARPLLYFGIVGIVLVLAKLHAAYVANEPYDLTGSTRFGWTISYMVLLVVGVYGTGLPDLPRSRRQALTSAVAGPAMAAVGVSLVQLVTGDALLPRFVVFGAAVATVPWSLACVAIAQGGRLRAEFRDRAFVVADEGEIMALRSQLNDEPERPAVVVGGLAPDGAASTRARSRPLVEQVVATGANLVVVDRVALGDETIVHQAAILHEHGMRIRTLSFFYEQWLGKLPVSELERVSLLFDIRELHGPRYVRFKRIVDLALAIPALGVLIVLLPIIVVGNVVGNHGSLLYRQARIGKAGRVFTILKFRTMRDTPDRSSSWTTADDPRVTPFGRFLRRSHLDELPQAVNVLRGDLSVVGPRPEQPHYVEELRAKLPFYDLRHLVRPGVTGWAQVKYGYAGDERDALEKLQYEFWYLRHQSLRLDARIIGRTVRSVFGSRGRGR